MRCLLLVVLFVPTLAFADVAPDDGGCKCDGSGAIAVTAPLLLGLGALAAARRRK